MDSGPIHNLRQLSWVAKCVRQPELHSVEKIKLNGAGLSGYCALVAACTSCVANLFAVMTKLLFEEPLTDQELSDKWLPTRNVTILQVAMLHSKTIGIVNFYMLYVTPAPKVAIQNESWDTDMRHSLASAATVTCYSIRSSLDSTQAMHKLPICIPSPPTFLLLEWTALRLPSLWPSHRDWGSVPSPTPTAVPAV